MQALGLRLWSRTCEGLDDFAVTGRAEIEIPERQAARSSRYLRQDMLEGPQDAACVMVCGIGPEAGLDVAIGVFYDGKFKRHLEISRS